ncbi:MAG: hypothetical protein AB7P03_15620 [Kofleriaceae bacterium]
MALNPVTELEALIDAFAEDNVPYALCSNLALGVLGFPRATGDIDLLIQAHDLDRALAAAKRVGFDIPARKMVFGLATGARREVQRVSKLDPDTGDMMPLDLLLANDELAEVWVTRITVDTGPRKLTVVSRAGLATMKRLAGRTQDLADLELLEGKGEQNEG